MFSQQEQQQYNRHLILPEIGFSGQLKLSKAKVLVVGAGGLGCPVLQYLTAAGVGCIGIVDADEVSQSNLQRQILYSIDDVGKSKVVVAKQKLERLNPFITIRVYDEFLTSANAERIVSLFDVIVDASDNFSTRYLVNDVCVLTNKPLVYGAIFKFEGQVSVFNYKGSGTYRCLFPTPPSPNAVPNCSEIGVLGVLPGIIGCLQANEVLKIICELKGVLSGKFLTYNAISMQQIVFEYKRTEAAQIKCLEKDYQFLCQSEKIKSITKASFKKHKLLYNLLDVRTLEERTVFNIGGQHIPLQELSTRFLEIKQDKPLVVYCKSGVRSKKAIQYLKNILDVDLFNLEGGVF